MADAERIAFEQMLVHNLKAPLSGLMASLEMLRDGDLGALTAVQRSAVSSMHDQGADLARMIDEVLDLARAESPTFPVQVVPVDLGAFIREVRGEWDGRIPRLTSSVASGETDVVADIGVLRRVFDNLLMNSCIHAGAQATVTVQAERSGDAVRITVADDGPGIAAVDAERVFDPFVTLSRPGDHRTHGLGLAYCRAALAAMGGTIILAQPGGPGATFVIELPAAVALARQALEQDQ
jgi:two-component system sensor histidine kinase KdpD